MSTDLMNKKLAGKDSGPNSKVTDNRVHTSIGEHPKVALCCMSVAFTGHYWFGAVKKVRTAKFFHFLSKFCVPGLKGVK